MMHRRDYPKNLFHYLMSVTDDESASTDEQIASDLADLLGGVSFIDESNLVQRLREIRYAEPTEYRGLAREILFLEISVDRSSHRLDSLGRKVHPGDLVAEATANIEGDSWVRVFVVGSFRNEGSLVDGADYDLDSGEYVGAPMAGHTLNVSESVKIAAS